MIKEDFLDFCYEKLNFNKSMKNDLLKLYNTLDIKIKNNIKNPNYYKIYIYKTLKIVGRISSEKYWETRGWLNYRKKYKEHQSKCGQQAVLKGVHKGRFSEKWFINKYGLKDGHIKYAEHIKMRSDFNQKEVYIKKHGEEKWNNLQSRKCQSLDSFIQRYGEEEGKIKFNNFVEKCKNTKDTFKKRYGKQWEIKWNSYIKNLGDANRICPLEKYDDFKLYCYFVDRETRKNSYLVEGIEMRNWENTLDHKFSKLKGFENNIPPYIIGHFVNLEMLSRKKNSAKHYHCSISKEDLMNEWLKITQH